MIPKVIHYCWFGRKPLSDGIKRNIETWKKHNRDYVIKKWDEDSFDVNAFPFTREAYALKKYAFVSDVVRLYALIKEGGIYIDTDVRLLKSFDDFLSYKSFLGKEFVLGVGTNVIGCESGCEWMVRFFEHYKHNHFISILGRVNNVPNTRLLTDFLNRNYFVLNDLKIFDVDVFTAKFFFDGSYMITDNTVAVHEFLGSWTDVDLSLWNKKRKKIRDRIVNVFMRWTLELKNRL